MIIDHLLVKFHIATQFQRRISSLYTLEHLIEIIIVCYQFIETNYCYYIQLTIVHIVFKSM